MNMLPFEQELSYLERAQLLRRTVIVEHGPGSWVTVDGKRALLLCSNDYLGLARHPALREAAASALERYGTGAGASRLVSGTTSLHEELEARIASFRGTEAALLFNSGYAANTGIIPALAGESDAIFSDRLNHASIIDGCRLSRASVHVYRHRDLSHLEELLSTGSRAQRRLIVTDGVFSMDGDIAPLPEIATLAERHDALVMVDDAHATGVLGKNGRGTVEHFGLQGRLPIQMGTLGKAIGSFGAYVAAGRSVIKLLRSTARTFLFSTALPPTVCAATLAALDILASESWRRDRLWQNRQRFADGLRDAGIDIGPSETPVIPVLVGDARRTLEASSRLLELGVFAIGIRPPTVPEGTSRIRTTVTTELSDGDVDLAISAFSRLKQDGII